MKVADRFNIKGRGFVVVLQPDLPKKPKLGSLLKCASGTYTIRGVEHSWGGHGPVGPYGLLTGQHGPAVGEEVEIVEAVGLRDAWAEGYEAGFSDGQNAGPDGYLRRRADNPYPEGK